MYKNLVSKQGTSIDTAKGKAFYIRTEVENERGKWYDNYSINAGYWVIHEGKYHHIYKNEINVYAHKFMNKEDFISFLEHTLIPDLKRSGTEATAEDFEEAIYWLRRK
jgi:hypothetical protein